MDKKKATEVLKAFSSLPLEQQTMLAAVATLLHDIANCLDTFELLTDVTPEDPPRDVEHFRVVRYRLLKLAHGVVDGSMGVADYRKVMAEIGEYLLDNEPLAHGA